MGLRIGIDGRVYGADIMSGVARSIQLLIRGLSSVKTNHRFYLFSDKKTKGCPVSFHPLRIRVPGVKMKKSLNHFVIWEQFLLPQVLQKERIKIFHSMVFPIPCSYIKGCKFLLTLYDILPWLEIGSDELFDSFRRYFVKWITLSIKKADKIITVSKSVRNDIIKLLNVPNHKVKVIYNSVNPYFHTLMNKEGIRYILAKKLGIRDKFILNVNVLTPRKNVETLIHAFTLLKQKGKIPHKLIIVGSTTFYKPHVDISKDVILTGAVSDEMLLYLYNTAELFVFPSLYEGFGYPPLEAMACGTPVIVSNAASLPEIVGPAGCIFNPKDILGLSERIVQVLEDRQLADKMRSEGLDRAKMFSYQKHTREVLSLYKEVSSS